MRSSSILVGAAMAGAALMLPACGDKDYPIENITVVEDGARPSQKAQSTLPTAILGKGGSLSDRLPGIFTNQVEADKAKHVIVACSDLDAYAEQIQEAYQRGIVITVVDPDPVVLASWCVSKGMVYPGGPAVPAITEKGDLLISFNRKAASMSVQKRVDDIVIEDEVPLVIFTGWLDDMFSTNLKGIDIRSRDIKKRFAPQRVTHVFPIDIPLEETEKGGWCLPAGASLSATATLTCDIYPMHSFADNASFTSDFYAVEAELTIHNGGLYNGRWQYTKGLNQYEACGFYLSECTVSANLMAVDTSGLLGRPTLTDSDTHKLVAGAPGETLPSEPYRNGFQWNFDGWLTGGNGLESSTPTPIQDGGWTWDNVSENAPSGMYILPSGYKENPDWLFKVDSLPRQGSGTTVPEIASGDLTFRCSWIWSVPDAKDDSEECYYMSVNFAPTYCWYRRILSLDGMTTVDVTPNRIAPFWFMLIPPSRKEGQRI